MLVNLGYGVPRKPWVCEDGWELGLMCAHCVLVSTFGNTARECDHFVATALETEMKLFKYV
jgi:hypothetical protein